MSVLIHLPSNAPAALDHAGPEHINPATSFKIGSMTYDQEENSYNLEWESRANFTQWLTHEQAVIGIKIQISKTQQSKVHQAQLYSTCKTFHCVHNGIGGKSCYMKKTTHERKIKSKQIDSRCLCYVQIKMYPHTDTILGKYNHNHFHPTSKDNLKYSRLKNCPNVWLFCKDWCSINQLNYIIFWK